MAMCGCSTLDYQTRVEPSIFGSSISAINQDPQWIRRPQGIITGKHWEKDDGQTYHYQLALISKGEEAYILQYTYLDEEDGGNTFGFIYSTDLFRIGRINDGDFVKEITPEMIW